MKRILLASASVVAFAGAAAAEVTWGGDAELGYNDEFNNGIFWGVGLTIAASQELDNGLTAGFTLDVDLNDNNFANSDRRDTFDLAEITTSDFVLSLTTDAGGLYFGDTPTAGEAYWSGVTNMQSDGFYEDGDANDDDHDGILRGEINYGAAFAAVSMVATDTGGSGDDAGTDADDLGAFNFVGTYDAGLFGLNLAYQEEDDIIGSAEILAVAGSTTFGGATITLAYAQNETADTTSTGIQVDYPFGPVTATVFYVSEPDFDDDNFGVGVSYAEGPLTLSALYHAGTDEDIQVNAAYDVGNGLSVYGGYRDEGDNVAGLQQAEIFYVGADYDLGGGALLRVSYAEVDRGPGGVDSTLDELGPEENLREGATVRLSFAF